MKKVSQQIDDMLLDYLDGNLGKADKEKVEQGLQQNPEWLMRMDELRSVTSLLSETTIEHPSKNFSSVVMTKLDQYPAQAGLSMRNGILLLIGVLLAVGIASILVASGTFDATSNIDLNQVELSKKLIKTPMPSFEFSGKLLVNIIIVLNLGLAWIVLDRVILRPLFRRRMQTGY
jgi:hypothetical protein